MDPRSTTEAVLILHLTEIASAGKVHITVLQRVLEWLTEQRLLVSYPSQYLTRRSFLGRLEARLGGLIDIVPNYIVNPNDLDVQIIHETLSSYPENSSILTNNLPAEFITAYPNHVWARLYAALINTSRIFDHWPFREVLQMSSDCYEPIRADDPVFEQDFSSVGVLAANGWTRSQVSLANECVMLYEAMKVFVWPLKFHEELVKSLRYSVFCSDAMCFHLLDAEGPVICWRNQLPALKPSKSKLAFLRLPAHKRAFWFCLVHPRFDEASRLLSSLDPPSEFFLTLCHELQACVTRKWRPLYNSETEDVLEKFFQHWRPDWCERHSNDSVSDVHHTAISEASDTDSESGVQAEDNDAETSSEDNDAETSSEDDDADGGVLCPSAP